MSQLDLAIIISEQECFRSLQDAELPGLETCRVFAAANSLAARFNSNHSDTLVFQEGVKQADGVASASDASNEQMRKPLFAFQDLAARFHADDPVKIAHHHGVGVGAENRA